MRHLRLTFGFLLFAFAGALVVGAKFAAPSALAARNGHSDFPAQVREAVEIAARLARTRNNRTFIGSWPSMLRVMLAGSHFGLLNTSYEREAPMGSSPAREDEDEIGPRQKLWRGPICIVA